jgi:hypothetical protein
MRDGKPFAAFGAAALQDVPAIFRGHPDEKPVGFLPAPPVRLKSTFALHDAGRLLRET